MPACIITVIEKTHALGSGAFPTCALKLLSVSASAHAVVNAKLPGAHWHFYYNNRKGFAVVVVILFYSILIYSYFQTNGNAII